MPTPPVKTAEELLALWFKDKDRRPFPNTTKAYALRLHAFEGVVYDCYDLSIQGAAWRMFETAGYGVAWASPLHSDHGNASIYVGNDAESYRATMQAWAHSAANAGIRFLTFDKGSGSGARAHVFEPPNPTGAGTDSARRCMRCGAPEQDPSTPTACLG